MPSIDIRRKIVGVKIVYYGPGLSGKTANLRYIHGQVPPKQRGRLAFLSVKGSGDQRIDLLALKLGKLKGFAVTYNLCTVPGQAFQNNARKRLLKGADGIVFVADSRSSRMSANLDSLQNLHENLSAYDVSLEDMPHVFQYNQRDRPAALPVSELRTTLNAAGALEFEASAVTGQGVMDTLKAIVRMVREDLDERL